MKRYDDIDQFLQTGMFDLATYKNILQTISINDEMTSSFDPFLKSNLERKLQIMDKMNDININ